MSDALQALEADEQDLAAIVPALIEHAQQQESEVAQLRKEIGEGLAIDPAKLATLEAGFGEGIAALEKLVPAKAAAATSYTFDSSVEGATEDARFTPTGFATAAEGGSPLFAFSGDTVAGEQNGASVPGYSVFTGTPVAVAGP